MSPHPDEVPLSHLWGLGVVLQDLELPLPPVLASIPLPPVGVVSTPIPAGTRGRTAVLHHPSCTVAAAGRVLEHSTLPHLLQALSAQYPLACSSCLPPAIALPSPLSPAVFAAWERAASALQLTHRAHQHISEFLPLVTGMDPSDWGWSTIAGNMLDDARGTLSALSDVDPFAAALLPGLPERLRAAFDEITSQEASLVSLVEDTWGEGQLEAHLGCAPAEPSEAVLIWSGWDDLSLGTESPATLLMRLRHTLTPEAPHLRFATSTIFCAPPGMLDHLDGGYRDYEILTLGPLSAWGGPDALCEYWEMARRLIQSHREPSAEVFAELLRAARDSCVLV